MKERGLVEWAIRILAAIFVTGPFCALGMAVGALHLGLPGPVWIGPWLLGAAALFGFGLGAYLALNSGGSRPFVHFSRTRRCKGCGHWNEPDLLFCQGCSRPLVTLGERRRAMAEFHG